MEAIGRAVVVQERMIHAHRFAVLARFNKGPVAITALAVAHMPITVGLSSAVAEFFNARSDIDHPAVDREAMI